MLATLELIIGVVFLLITMVGFWTALPGKPLNGWLLKHGVAEAMFPLLVMATLLISAAAFTVSFQQ